MSEHISEAMTAQSQKLEALLETHAFAFPGKEHTVYSVLGIGKKENRTSALLAFFLQTPGPHGLGEVFVEAFFRCMAEAAPERDFRRLRFDEVTAVAEAYTMERNRIDLVVRGRDWLLIIENKIGHELNNDLASYEEHAARFHEPNKFFAVLSPNGVTDRDWVPVTYEKYCAALRMSLATACFARPQDKWQAMARDFVLELENVGVELRKRQVDFVREHLGNLIAPEQLWDFYQNSLVAELEDRLRREIPDCLLNACLPNARVDGGDWALRADFGNRELPNFIFQTPLHVGGNVEGKFRIGVWVHGFNTAQRIKAHERLDGEYIYEPDGETEWWERCFVRRADAFEGLSDLARKLIEIVQLSAGGV